MPTLTWAAGAVNGDNSPSTRIKLRIFSIFISRLLNKVAVGVNRFLQVGTASTAYQTPPVKRSWQGAENSRIHPAPSHTKQVPLAGHQPSIAISPTARNGSG
jgi:hypothetical protein